MGPLYTPKDLLRVWNEFLEACTGSTLEQNMSKAFIKANRDALAEKAGCITISEKEQKRVTDLVKKLEYKVSQLTKDLKSAFQSNATLRAEIEKLNPKKPIWWHWIMDQCRNEDCSYYGSNVSQGPIADDIGEDINLFEKVREYNDAQRNKETNYCCDGCGKQLKMMHRHAIADNNCITDESGDPLYKAPLVGGQESGTFLTKEKYDQMVADLKQLAITK